MLTDVEIAQPDARISMILSAIGDGSPMPTKIGVGMFLCKHWSFDHLCAVKDKYPEFADDAVGYLGSYGVCDTPEQFMKKFGERLRDDPRKFVVSFVEIRRDGQSADGGWRWHKWGEYVGEQKPTMEYIHDEPEIESVHTYHIYEIA